MKKRIDVIAGEETYKNLQSFKDVNELNVTVRAYKERFKDVLTKSAVKVLELLQCYSAKYTGVSFRTKNKIADELGINRRTVIRVCQLLENLGIIRQYETKRQSDMQQSSNAIVIQPIVEEKEEIVTQEVVKMSHQENNIFSKTNNIKTLNKRNTVPSSPIVDKSVNNFHKANFVAHWVPETFANLANNFYSDAKSIQEFWKVVKQCNRIVDHETEKRAFTKDQELSIAIKAFKEFVMKVKNGVKMIKGEFAYFNGIVNNLMDKLYFDADFVSQ